MLLLLLPCVAWAQSYAVRYQQVDTAAALPPLPGKFNTQTEAAAYIQKIPAELRLQGFLAASVDAVVMDTVGALVALFLGERYQWTAIRTATADADVLAAVQWPAAGFAGQPLDFAQVQAWQQRILDYLETTGHPFGKVFLDSISLAPAASAALRIDRGPFYTIDSLHVEGNVKIQSTLLERHLGIAKGSPYNRKRLEAIATRLRELGYVEETAPAAVSLRGTGAVINLYLKPKRNSQINALVGFLPNSDAATGKKFLVTGEAAVLLRNSLGAGETIGLTWQQLQQASPRLNLLYQHPYLFRSAVGLAFSFDMFRKDSTWLNLNLNLGATYALSAERSAAFFLQRRQTILSGVDTASVRLYKRLPTVADVASSNLGIAYTFIKTDYRLNPRRGMELNITGAAGTKKLRPNNQILELKDAAFDYAKLYDTVKQQTYQVRVMATAARYLPVGRQSTVKTALNIGLFQSGFYYLNELFQVGGYKLLRGFTEESEYLSHYALGTLEYRYLIGTAAYFFGFADGGWGRNAAQKLQYTYIGTGLGLALETGAGIFNLAWAVGKRNDTELNLRQSKVHLGFVNYF